MQSLLEASSRNRKQIERRLESGEFDAFNLDEEDGADETVDASDTSTDNAAGHSDTLSHAGGESALFSSLTSKADGPMTGEGTDPNLPFQDMAALRDHVLSIAACFASALKVPEISAALLLARAIEKDQHGLDRLLSIMKRRKMIVAVHVPVKDFERHFGYLLEDGLALPFHVSLEPIAEGPTLTGRFKALADTTPRKSFSCFGSTSLKRYDDDDELRTIVSKRILTAFKPLMICDERDRPLPARLVAVADMVITGNNIDANLIADVLAICHKIPIGRSWFLMNELDFQPQHLGIDDLAIAIRPGRSLTKIMAILATLEAENRAVAEAKEDEDKEGRLGALLKRSDAKKREKYSGCFDIIEPVKELAAPEPGKGQTAKQSAKPSTGKDHLFVERLAGYGDAQQWALDLKLDLEAFGNKEVAWSDLSSRLLL